jgi:hypothetical protein
MDKALPSEQAQRGFSSGCGGSGAQTPKSGSGAPEAREPPGRRNRFSAPHVYTN